MFYNKQNDKSKNEYKDMLRIIGSLTRLFSESDTPYLPYRAHENIFCKYFKAENLARLDCSADAKKSEMGIGLKTWVGRDDQKIAEFGKLRNEYHSLEGMELVRKIAEYRNKRIKITKNIYDINILIYHIVKRVPGSMQVIESVFEEIDMENICLIDGRGNSNNTYFTDNKHEYHFSKSKNTLYMIFKDYEIVDTFDVDIMEDPYDYLLKLSNSIKITAFKESYTLDKSPQLCLRLYSTKSTGEKVVYEKSGLNQWNANGRPRNKNEVYIPYPVEDRNRAEDFFPPRNQVFKLKLPDGNLISAKVCQENGKAIMSNPNRVLGEWLLRKVFELDEGELVTYKMLEEFGIDSVVFTKITDEEYSIDFSELGTYEEFYQNN